MLESYRQNDIMMCSSRYMSAMGSPTKFGDITVGRQNYKVFGRLIRLWHTKNKYAKTDDSLLSIDGVLPAEDGAMVQITIPNKVEKQFRPLLSLGYVYMLTDVSAVHATHKKFIYHRQSYMLQFKTSSKVRLMQSRGASIPRFAFDFSQFDQLPSKDNQSKPLLDLIGVISYIGLYDYASPTSHYKLRKIHICNQDEQTQEINLWARMVKHLTKAWSSANRMGRLLFVFLLA
ncbi:hypothetical protein BRADI_3g50186v3 [Brachypodium distachyon]|uniref:DUF223 domain-containing protein n=1 Tax=Brachypodium distachyon TaxID=15368 RepID=A0A2K2D4D5_BRADI|nr:hypothetical protein BRADI_3g50186v3 [Brachypodium distachyon]